MLGSVRGRERGGLGEDALCVEAMCVDALSVDALSVGALRVDALRVDALSVDALRVDALSVDALSVDASRSLFLGFFVDCSGEGSVGEWRELCWGEGGGGGASDGSLIRISQSGEVGFDDGDWSWIVGLRMK